MQGKQGCSQHVKTQGEKSLKTYTDQFTSLVAIICHGLEQPWGPGENQGINTREVWGDHCTWLPPQHEWDQPFSKSIHYYCTYRSSFVKKTRAITIRLKSTSVNINNHQTSKKLMISLSVSKLMNYMHCFMCLQEHLSKQTPSITFQGSGLMQVHSKAVSLIRHGPKRHPTRQTYLCIYGF